MRIRAVLPPKFLKTIFLLGPDNTDSEMHKMLAFQIQDIEDCTIIGDGERLLTEKEITRQLTGKINSDTKIVILAHGEAVEGRHAMSLLDGPNETTNYVLKILAKCAGENPLAVHIHSCFAGAAADDVSVLPPASTIVCYGPSNDITYTDLNSDLIRRQLVIHDELIKSIITELPASVIQSMTIAMRLNNGQTTSFTLRPPADTIALKASFKEYLDYQVIKLKEKIRSYCKERLLPDHYVQEEAQIIISEEVLEKCMHKYFISAILKKREGDIKTMLTRGFDPNFSWQISTPLLMSIKQGSTKITDLLLKEGSHITVDDIADIKDINKVGMHLVMDHAIQTNNADVVSALLDRGFKIENYLLTKIINHNPTIEGRVVDNSQIIEKCLMNETIQSLIVPHISKFCALAQGKPDIAKLLEKTFPQTVSMINSKTQRALKKARSAASGPFTKDR